MSLAPAAESISVAVIDMSFNRARSFSRNMQLTRSAGLSTEESEPYYHSRPWLSQIGAWASRQSTVLASRAELDDRVAELSARWPEGTEVPMPDFWGGYLIVPDRIEFWQSHPNRLHDRLSYRRAGDNWVIERLVALGIERRSS